jgi:hypothetical protein
MRGAGCNRKARATVLLLLQESFPELEWLRRERICKKEENDARFVCWNLESEIQLRDKNA